MLAKAKMENRGKHGDIDEQAARWAARIDRGALSPAEEIALAEWRDADTRHRGALARAQALLLPLEGAEASRTPDAAPKIASAPLPRWLAGVGSLAAALLFAFVLLQTPSGGHSAYQTARGEVLRVPLEDGSVITLNTATKVDVDFRKGQRSIHLISGEGYFEVAHDTARPFIVSADDYTVKAIGTAFTVRRPTPQSLLVVVQEGIVEIGRKHGPPLRLEAGARVTISLEEAAPAISALDGEQLTQELAWREGKIALTGQTLSEAAAAFNRYNAVPIDVAPELAQLEVVGWFSANDPLGFSRAVAETMDADVEVTSRGILLKSIACDDDCDHQAQ